MRRGVLLVALLMASPAFGQASRQINAGDINTALTSGPINTVATNQFFSQNGARIQRLNDRLFVGGATANDGAFPNVVQDWLSAMTLGSVVVSQFATLNNSNAASAVGGTFGVQTLNFTSAGTAGLGSTSYVVNNNATLATSAWAFYGEAHKTSSSAGSIYAMELDTRTLVTSGTPTPYQQGSVVGLQLASGAGLSASGQFDAAAAIQVESNPMKFAKGFIFGSTALTAANGVGGNGIAIEAARGQTFRWANAVPGVDAEIWGDANGLHLTGAGGSGWQIASNNNLTSTSSAAFTPQINITNTTASGNGTFLIMSKSRNGAAVTASDTLGALVWAGADTNGTMQTAATISAVATSVGVGSVAATIVLGQPVQLGSVSTGTPVASLCIDASNNIIKKTTTGPCI